MGATMLNDSEVYVFPMSFAQQRLWFLEQLAPDKAFYNLPAAMRLAADVRTTLLEAALNEIVARHEALRTVFSVQDGQPVQLILPELTIPLRAVDLTSIPAADREHEARRLAQEEARTPFNLSEGPLVRAQVLKLDTHDNVLLLTLHHIVGDGWSMNLLFEELTAAYAALAAGRSPVLPELPIQYADFAVWQRNRLRGAVLDEQIAYWEQQLAGAAVLELPGDRPRPQIKSYRGSQLVVPFSAGLTQAVTRFSREEGVTPFMTALAAFNVLLHRYTSETDIAVGSPIANRNRTETENLIGFFVNTLVLRTDVDGDPTFHELLRRVRETTLGAYAHQDLPFEMVVERLHPDRDPGRNPLFQVIFQLFESPAAGKAGVANPGLSVADVHTGTAKFDLEVSLFQTGQTLTAKYEYSSDLFEATTIARLAEHFERLLESAVAAPQCRISELRMLSPREERIVVSDWNGTASGYPRDASVVELFEEHVAATPEAPAAVFGTRAMSYAVLNRSSNQLAHALLRHGVQPGSIVAVCTDRSVNMLIAALGTLKAGAAYLPLDPEYPVERLRFMLEDAQCRLLLTGQGRAGELAACGVPVLRLDADSSLIASQPTSNCAPAGGGDALAYVMYTSGSTGDPKGTCIPHRGIVRLVRNTDYIDIRRQDRIAQMSNFSFDAATFEIWGALLNGACLVGVPREVALSPGRLARELREQGITTAFVTTSLFNQIVREKPDTFASLRHLLFGGSAVDPRPVREVLEHGAPERLIHVYGPTENTTFTTWQQVIEVPPDAVTVPIGRPIANTQVYVLDPHGQPVPIGVPGELYTGGDGLALGYLNRPQLSAERFVEHPFDERPGSRLYRTGDLVRWRRDGSIEFLRRLDEQVKIRGFRVEPREVEAVLLQHPGLGDAVVVAQPHSTGDQRLVAYVVPAANTEASPMAADGAGARIAEWQHIYDRIIYDDLDDGGNASGEATFDSTGWNSSYTGLPISREEMEEQVAGTVSRVLEHRPSRVLEIGAGTGLLLFPIAPHCEHYTATDFSSVAIGFLRAAVERSGELANRIRILEQHADDFSSFVAGEFDTVILNSVVQYFPNTTLLMEVIRGALAVLAPGGRIFVGDVRNLRLLETLHTSIELHRAPDVLIAELRERVRARAAEEHELVLDPLFFAAQGAGLPGVTGIEVQLKRGLAHNELSMFRYDVVLYTDEASTAGAPSNELHWERDRIDLPRLRARLAERPEGLLVRKVPNARVVNEIERWQQLFASADSRCAGELALETSHEAGIEPEQLWRLGLEDSRRASICWSSDADMTFDVEFSARNDRAPRAPGMASCVDRIPEKLANDPLGAHAAQRLSAAVRRYLKERVPEYMVPAAVVVLERLPLTANGKVDRGALPAPEGVRPELATAYVAPRTAVEEALARIWAEVLGLERVGVADNFFELGGDSILSIQIIARARQAGWQITPQQLFQQQTVGELAAVAVPLEAAAEAEEAVTGDVPLLPVQAWFFEQAFSEAQHFNQAVLLPLPPGTALGALRAALAAVEAHHDALRLRFSETATGWQGRCTAAAAAVCEEWDLTGMTGAVQAAAEQAAMARVQGSLDLASGPLTRMAVLRRGAAGDRLLWVVHHLAVDGVSWRILLEDLQTALGQGARGEAVVLPPRTSSIRRWGERLQAYAQQAAVGDAAYWRGQQTADAPLPRDLDGGANTVAAERTLVVALDEAETRGLLQEVPGLWHTQINDALLTALLETYAAWTGRAALRIDLEGHGREDLFAGVDVSRTVGWFTSIFPVWLHREGVGDLAATLRGVKEQLRAIPTRGLSYGVLRYLGPAPLREQLAGPRAAISMNYLGQFAPGTRPAPLADTDAAATGPLRSPRAHRAYLLEINAAVLGGRLRVYWTYSSAYHAAATIERLAAGFLDTLRALIRLGQTVDAPRYTPSDFPHARLTQNQLDAVLAELDATEGGSVA